MRLRAPAGTGNPSVGGITLTPDDKGIFEVTNPAAIEHLLGTGFVDIDAPKKDRPIAAAAPSDSALRTGVLSVLKAAGVVVGDADNASDDRLVAALRDLGKSVDAHVTTMVKAAEDRVLGEFSGELTATKERADKAETDLASAREVLTAMDGQVAALTTRAEAAEADLAKLKPKA